LDKCIQVGDKSTISEPEDPNEKGVQTDRKITSKSRALHFLSSDEELERRIHN